MRSDNLPISVMVSTGGKSIFGIVGRQAFDHLKNSRKSTKFITSLASDLKSMIYFSNFRNCNFEINF